MSSGGCAYTNGIGSSGSSSGDGPYGGSYTVIPSAVGTPDSMATTFASSQSGMNVVNAWQFTSGAGVTVGVPDTGLDFYSGGAEFAPATFASGESANRSLRVAQSFGANGYWEDAQVQPSCSHGTRISGLVGAPRNGRGPVGAAYGANMYNVEQADGEIPDNGAGAVAIHLAATRGSQVVVMAWGLLDWSDVVANEIYDHYYNGDVMFVGAAGTCLGTNSLCNNTQSAVYPAGMEEVLAVSGANADGSRPGTMFNYGTKSGVMGYTNLATTGLERPDIVGIGGSSGSTGAVGGIATLVRARFPGLSARGTMNQIMSTAGNRCGAPAVWRDEMINASAAVGGACVKRIRGANVVYIPSTAPRQAVATYETGVTGGSGSYAYRWSNGATTPSTTIVFLPRANTTVYPAEVSVTVTDLVYGTADRRVMSITVNSGTQDPL